MTNLVLQSFAGMIPRRNRQKLPPAGSELAENCDLLSGDLRALRGLTQATDVDATGARCAFRIPAALRGDVDDPPPTSTLSELDLWYTFGQEFCHFVKGPLVNDKYNRWYYTVPGEYPRYQSVSRQLRGDPALVLGVPRPEKQGTLTPNTAPVAFPFAVFPGNTTVTLKEDVPWVRSILTEGGQPAYTWEVTAGALPNGISLDETSGLLSGVPTTPGGFNATITITDSTAPTANTTAAAFTFTVQATDVPGTQPVYPNFYVTPVPVGRVNSPYIFQPQHAGGGRDPKDPDYPSVVADPVYQFDIQSGALPQGLRLDVNTGVISGTPTIVCDHTITMVIQDQYFKQDTISVRLVMEEDPLSPSEGDLDLAVTRCYVYTFVSAASEEGPPSEPICAEGTDDDFWTLCGMSTEPQEPYNSEGMITKKRIYRTITGTTGGSFFFVDEIDIGESCYKDEVSTEDVSLNQQLESDSWEPPPQGLVGLVRHPNGFLVGFLPPYDIYFSEPYRPHAWPPEYVLSTEGEISALGIFGASVGIPTNAHPYVCSGSSPANMSLTKSNVSEPCLNQFSVVSTEAGVVYASANGLVILSPSGVQVMTKQLVTREEWSTRYRPDRMRGTQFGFEYFGVDMQGGGLPQQGFIFSPQEASSVFTETNMALQRSMVSLQTDLYNGQVYTIANDRIWWWADWDARPEVYRWRTVEFVTPRPVNFGAYRIDFDPTISYAGQSPDVDPYLEWNEDRLAAGPLDPINFTAFNEVRQYDDAGWQHQLPQLRSPLGGSALFSLYSLGAAYVEVLLYTDGELRYQKTLYQPGRYRLPLGYKHDLFQVEFRGTADLHHFKMAETGKELARI